MTEWKEGKKGRREYNKECEAPRKWIVVVIITY